MNRNLLFSALIAGAIATQSSAAAPDDPVVVGAVYAMTNDTRDNAVVVFDRHADGTLTESGTYSTNGEGGFAGDFADALGSEGALVLNEDKSRLYAVNAGSDNISVFKVLPDGLDLVQTRDSHGSFPVSIALYQDLLYVLNSGGDGSIAGFHVGPSGKLKTIPGSTRNLGAGGNNPPYFVESPAQVSFDPTGHWLVVTLKALNEIRLYEVDENGLPASEPVINASNGSIPFGFSFDAGGHLIVAEAFGPGSVGDPESGAVSSYSIEEDGTLTTLSATVENDQTATCWMVSGPHGRFAYASNNVSNSITGYLVGNQGHLTLLDPDGVTAALEDEDEYPSGPVDMGVTSDGLFLYNLNAGRGTVTAFQIDTQTGALTPISEVGGLPEDNGAAGLAVR